MVKYFELTPECPAHRAENTRDPDDPHIVTSAHLVFEFRLRNTLIVSSRAYAVTDGLLEALTQAGISGFSTGIITTSIAPWVEAPDEIGELPHMTALVIRGQKCVDDVILNERGDLLVSPRTLDVILRSNPMMMHGPVEIEN